MNDLNGALSFLLSKHIKMTIDNEWFKDCCQFYVSSNPQGSADELRNFVYEQWLLADLAELGAPCLPSHAPTSSKCRLDGKYALQVNEIMNIGESGYSQIKQIRSGNAISTFCESEEKVPAWQPKRSRILKLSLTDGTLKLSALEFEPIAVLREPYIPGLKVLIIGPIECRRGVLLLTPKNIEILGGEVDSLLVCNAVENILARKLDLEENPNPLARIASTRAPDIGFTETESDTEIDLYLQDFESSLLPNRAQNVVSVPEVSSTMAIPRDRLNLGSPSVESSTADRGGYRASTVSSISYNQTEPHDRLNFGSASVESSTIDRGGNRAGTLSSISYNQTEVSSRDLANSSIDSRNQDSSIPSAYERSTFSDTYSRINDSGNTTMDPRNQSSIPSVSDTRTLDVHSKCSNWLQSNSGANPCRKEKSPIIGVVTPIPSNKRNAESPPLQQDTKSSKIDVPVSNQEVRKTDGVSIAQLKDILQRQSPCSVKCFIKVRSLKRKPRIKNEQWLVITEVTDDEDTLDVTFDDEFLQEKIFMISACEVMSQKDKIATNPAVKDQIDEMIRNAILRLLALRGQFSIRIVPGNEYPIVMNVVS